MKRFVNYFMVFALLLSAMAYSCSGGKTNQSEADTELTEDTLAQDEMEIMLPTPSEVLSIVLTSGIKYSDGYMAPLGIERKTVMVKHKALVLGVYFADFAYANYYNQRSASSEYFKALQELTRDLGVGSILNDAYFKRFDANLNNPDSLDAIFEDFSQNAYNTIIESGNRELLSMIGIGAAIEVLHIGINSIESAANPDEAIVSVVDQSAVFDNYYNNFIAYNSDKPEFKSLTDDVTIIFKFFKEKLAKANNEFVVTDSKQHFTISGGDAAKLSKTDLAQLRCMVSDVRKKLIDLKY
ncbi:MAG: hypothetical protein AB1777_11720 [Bacteroidota bacterium]